jgi:hypothetical protein
VLGHQMHGVRQGGGQRERDRDSHVTRSDRALRAKPTGGFWTLGLCQSSYGGCGRRATHVGTSHRENGGAGVDERHLRTMVSNWYVTNVHNRGTTGLTTCCSAPHAVSARRWQPRQYSFPPGISAECPVLSGPPTTAVGSRRRAAFDFVRRTGSCTPLLRIRIYRKV